jgi:hypothetical protein
MLLSSVPLRHIRALLYIWQETLFSFLMKGVSEVKYQASGQARKYVYASLDKTSRA